MKTEILLCECCSSEHQIIVNHDIEDKEVYLSIHLNTQRNFFKRILYGIKYILGYKCIYGAWDEIILSEKHVEVLENMIKTISNGKRI